MTQPRVPQGVPAGGRFAAQRRPEASTTLDDGGFKPLSELRREGVIHAGQALRAIGDSYSIDVHRDIDPSFPSATYGEAVHALQALTAKLGGAEGPPEPGGTDAAMAAYRGRLSSDAGWEGGRVPLSKLQDSTRAAVGGAMANLTSNDMFELSRADAQFPAEDLSRAVQALNALDSRLAVTPLPSLSPERRETLVAALNTDSRYAAYQPSPPPAAPRPIGER